MVRRVFTSKSMGGRQTSTDAPVVWNSNETPIQNASTMFKLREFPPHTWQIHNVDLFLQSGAEKVCQGFGPLDDYSLQFVFDLSKKRKKLKLQLAQASQQKKDAEVVHSSLLKIRVTASNDEDWKSEFVLDIRNPNSKQRFKLPDSVYKGLKGGSLFVTFRHEMVVSTSRKETSSASLKKAADEMADKKSERAKLLNNETEIRPLKIENVKSNLASRGDADKSKSLSAKPDAARDDADELAAQLSAGLSRKRVGGGSQRSGSRGSDWSVVEEKEDEK